jgi:hypothetical protein
VRLAQALDLRLGGRSGLDLSRRAAHSQPEARFGNDIARHRGQIRTVAGLEGELGWVQ